MKKLLSIGLLTLFCWAHADENNKVNYSKIVQLAKEKNSARFEEQKQKLYREHKNIDARKLKQILENEKKSYTKEEDNKDRKNYAYETAAYGILTTVAGAFTAFYNDNVMKILGGVVIAAASAMTFQNGERAYNSEKYRAEEKKNLEDRIQDLDNEIKNSEKTDSKK